MIFCHFWCHNIIFLKCCFFPQESLDVMSTNDDNTLGFTLELYSRYMEAAKVRELFRKALGLISFLERNCFLGEGVQK